jgi:hypothetical protein
MNNSITTIAFDTDNTLGLMNLMELASINEILNYL